jgi:hypothetical protein
MTKQPSFQPNPKLGEGTATPDEIAYRKSLIYNLSVMYEPIMNTVHSNIPTLNKIDKIHIYINQFVVKNKKEADLSTHSFFYKAVLSANDRLHKLKPELPTIHPEYKKLDPIRNQQITNVPDIGNYLLGRISQALMINEIQKQIADDVFNSNVFVELREDSEDDDTDPTPPKKKRNPDDELDDSIDSAFNESQNRLDLMGLTGYVESNRIGQLSTYVAAGLVLGEVIYVEWLTAGDEHVCADCDDLESNSPYPASEYPSSPHPGCRCGPGEITIGLVNQSGDFVILHLYY